MKCRNYPKVIEIQFHNACNSYCMICPYKDMNYNYENMSMGLFEKFLNEIDENQLIRLIPYLNNEPFLDSCFVDKVEVIRNKYKNIEIEISTNVSIVKEDDIKRLKNLDITELRLSVFGYSDEIYKRMMPGLNRRIVFDKLKMISRIMKNCNTRISIVMIDDNEIPEDEFIKMKSLCDELGFCFERWGYLDRSGNVTYKSNNIHNKNVSMCEQKRPLERMHILASGDVILCCQDWNHTVVLGNLKENTIKEIWNSKEYENIRNMLYNKNEESPEICQKCKLGH